MLGEMPSALFRGILCTTTAVSRSVMQRQFTITQQKKSLEANADPKAGAEQHQDPWNDYQINGREASGGIQKYSETAQLTQRPLHLNTHRRVHTRTRAHHPGLCGAAKQNPSLQRRNLHPQVCLMLCNQHAHTVLFHYVLFTFRIYDGSGKLEVCTPELNELNLYWKLRCFQK